MTHTLNFKKRLFPSGIAALRATPNYLLLQIGLRTARFAWGAERYIESKGIAFLIFSAPDKTLHLLEINFPKRLLSATKRDEIFRIHGGPITEEQLMRKKIKIAMELAPETLGPKRGFLESIHGFQYVESATLTDKKDMGLYASLLKNREEIECLQIERDYLLRLVFVLSGDIVLVFENDDSPGMFSLQIVSKAKYASMKAEFLSDYAGFLEEIVF